MTERKVKIQPYVMLPKSQSGYLVIYYKYILFQAKYSSAVVDRIIGVHITIVRNVNHLIVVVFLKCMTICTDAPHPAYTRYGAHLMAVHIQGIVGLRRQEVMPQFLPTGAVIDIAPAVGENILPLDM